MYISPINFKPIHKTKHNHRKIKDIGQKLVDKKMILVYIYIYNIDISIYSMLIYAYDMIHWFWMILVSSHLETN